MCNSKEDVKFDSSSTNNTLNVAMMFVDLQVQPYFEYVEGKENFDTGTVYRSMLQFQLEPTTFFFFF